MSYNIFILACLGAGYAVLFLGILLMCISVFNAFKYKGHKTDPSYRPTFTLIVPAHNEEKVLERTIQRFLETTYPDDKKEMILINDGSTDGTESIAAQYAYRIIDSYSTRVTYTESNYKNITLLNRRYGPHGKSHSVNDALNFSTSNIVIFIDADIQVGRDIFERAARHFFDQRVGAVSGYIAVNSSSHFLTQLLDFEYVIGQQLLRRGFNVIGVHYIIPGGCAIIRRSVLKEISGYQHDTLAEDTDLTWRINTDARKEILFDPSIRVLADEPYRYRDLWNQRLRWARGNIEVTWKHRHKIGRRKHGSSVTYGFPFWISSLILPFAFMLSVSATMLAIFYGVDTQALSWLSAVIGVAFFGSWCVGTVLNKGKSWLAGLLTPGIPMLVCIIVLILFRGGLEGLLTQLGYPSQAVIAGVLFSSWILIAVPGTYLSLEVMKRNSALGDAMQTLIFGYWMFLITTILSAYAQELQKKEKKWIRTER